jgi:4-amino-4-deoxy-L-arabinose transferase-like glycosyltransferase
MRKLIAKLVCSPACMVSVGLLARLVYMAASHCYRFDLQYWHGFEMAGIGRFLAMGRGFMLEPSAGPSAWTGPIYPGVLAIIFRIFGVFSDAAAVAVVVFNSIFAALTSWTVYRISRRVCNETVAVWAGWIWAFLPSSVYFSLFWIWETTLSAFLLSAVFLLTLSLENNPRLLPWCGYGLLWGLLGLTNPAALAWLPFSGCWLLFRSHRRPYVLRIMISALLFWVTLTPWLMRNYITFHQPFLLRSGFGVNLRAGNNPLAEGWWVQEYTYRNPVLLAEYRKLGEAAFVDGQGRLAREWIEQHPQRFLALTIRKVIFFWTGIPHQGLEIAKNFLFSLMSLLSIAGLLLAIKRHIHGVFLFATLFISYPLIYYITFPQPRYRHAIEPELVVLAVYFVWAGLVAMRRRAAAFASG